MTLLEQYKKQMVEKPRPVEVIAHVPELSKLIELLYMQMKKEKQQNEGQPMVETISGCRIGEIMKNPLATFYGWQVSSGALDGWTSYHIAAGAFLCKIFQWLEWSDFWCVMGVFIIGVLWEIFEWVVENWRPYGTKNKWMINTLSDLFVETAMAWWMVI